MNHPNRVELSRLSAHLQPVQRRCSPWQRLIHRSRLHSGASRPRRSGLRAPEGCRGACDAQGARWGQPLRGFADTLLLVLASTALALSAGTAPAQANVLAGNLGQPGYVGSLLVGAREWTGARSRGRRSSQQGRAPPAMHLLGEGVRTARSRSAATDQGDSACRLRPRQPRRRHPHAAKSEWRAADRHVGSRGAHCAHRGRSCGRARATSSTSSRPRAGGLYRLQSTESDNEDAGGASGWSIADRHHYHIGSVGQGWETGYATSVRMEIRGAATEESCSAPNLAGRRQVLKTSLTVGRWRDLAGGEYFGYLGGSSPSGGLFRRRVRSRNGQQHNRAHQVGSRRPGPRNPVD